MATYEEILERKKFKREETGFTATNINPLLFDFQKFCVERMCKMGKGAVFAGCGNGKTNIQLEWALQVANHTGGGGTYTCSAVSQ